MRSELISAELYDQPTVLAEQVGHYMVACGNHIMTHTLKSGKLLDCSDALPFKPKRMALCGSKLIISGSSCSRSYKLSNGSLSSSESLGSFEVLSCVGSVSVVLSKSSDNSDRILGYIEGDLSVDSKINVIYSGFVGRVSQSSGLIAAVIGEAYKKVFVYDLVSKSSREFRHDSSITCIATHPLNEEVSVGDRTGQIARFSMSGESYRHYAFHHWHSVPLSTIQYSSKGSVLLSGAEEGVVCIWNNAASGTRPQFIPHLGGPIAHITAGNQYAIVSLRTNKILVIDMFTRQIQSTVSGTIHETHSNAIARVSAVDHTSSSVAITTSTHCQIFDTSSRKSVTKTPIPIQNRNYVPTNLQKRVTSARPWECDHVAILQQDNTQYLIASLSRRHRHRNMRSEAMIKFFISSDSGHTWSLDSVVMNAHANTVTHMAAIPAMNGFITVSSDGEVKQWLHDGKHFKVSKQSSFKNSTTPTFISVSEAGLLIIGFSRFVTLWDPIRLVELTAGSMRLGEEMTVVAGGLIEGTTELFTLSSTGSVDLWNLKTFAKMSSIEIEKMSTQSPLFTVVENRLIVSSQNGIFSISRNDNNELICEEIIVSEKIVSSICKIGSELVLAANRGKEIWKLTSDATSVGEFRIPEPEAQLETTTDTVDNDDHQMNDEIVPRRVFQPLSALISKLFPIENELDSLPNPETSFDMLARELLVASK